MYGFSNKIYLDICNNLKMFSILENTKEKKKKINNAKLRRVVNFFLLLKFYIYKTFNIIKKLDFDNNKMYIIYTKKVINVEKIVNKKLKSIKTEIILSKEIIEIIKNSKEINIKNCIQNNKLDKTLFYNNIYKVLKFIANLRGEAIEENNIYVLMKNINSKYRELLINLSINYKSLNIITYNVKEFKGIENYIYEKYEIPIIVSNNKRKALLRAKYVINLQLDEEEINEFNLSRDSIIFNLSNNIIRNINGFNGVIINNIELKLEKKINKSQYIYSRFLNYMGKNDSKLIIGDLIGNNGYITTRELLK